MPHRLAAEQRSRATADLARRVAVPRLVREAVDRGWWAAAGRTGIDDARGRRRPTPAQPTILPRVEPDVWARLTLAPRVVAPVEPAAGHAIVLAAIRDGAAVTAAVEGTTVVGLAVTRHGRRRRPERPAGPRRRARDGAGEVSRRSCSRRRLEWTRPGDVDHEALVTVAERDPIEPLDVATRVAIARRLLAGAGYDVAPAGGAIGAADPTAIRATRQRPAGRRANRTPGRFGRAAYTGRSVGAPTRTRRHPRPLADAAGRNGHAADSLERFSPAVRDWFASSFEAPTQAQVEGWAAISGGHHTLIHAPTGSGKTLAAFLWCLDRLRDEPSPPPARGQIGQVRVLYISPLKALTYDVERNLRAPLTGIGLAAQRLGTAVPRIIRGRLADRATRRRTTAARSPATRRTS